jgi:hypothetical protein
VSQRTDWAQPSAYAETCSLTQRDLLEAAIMNSDSSSTRIGPVSRVGINPYTTVFAGYGKGSTATVNPVVVDRVTHEPESRLPNTLVPGLSKRAAQADDGLISQA